MGASVTQGQAIAQSGGALGEQGAGNATGAHLHFEIHNPQDTAVDPQQYISVGGAPLNFIGIQPQTGVMGSINSAITKGLGAAGLNQVGAAADTAFTAGKTALGWTTGAGKALGFLTNTSNWKRIGLFMAGSILLVIVLIELLKQTDAGKEAISSAKSAAKDAAVAAAA